MDWIRYTIIASIIGIALVLVNEWTAFKTERNVTPVQEARQTAASPLETPELELPVASTSEDLPSTSEEAPVEEALVSENTGSTITVQTDVLLLDID